MAESKIKISSDAFLYMLVEEMKSRQLSELPTLAEMNAAFVPSAEFQQKISREEKIFNNRQRKTTMRRSIRRTISVAVITIAIFSCLLLPVAAVRQAVVQTLLEWKEGFTNIVFTTEEVQTTPLNVSVNYLPEGYIPDDPFAPGDYYRLIAHTEEGATLSIEIAKIDDGNIFLVDNEYTVYYTVTFDDIEALWMPHEQGFSTLLWTDDGYYIAVFSELDLTEVLQIAQSISL